MSHFAVDDANPSFLGNALLDPMRTAVGIGFGVLRDELAQRRELVGDRWLADLRRKLGHHEGLECPHLDEQLLERAALGGGVVPVDVERRRLPRRPLHDLYRRALHSIVSPPTVKASGQVLAAAGSSVVA
ncbi:MAG TPA: hypothetical protein VGC42_16560 [Kofleriaceae bacterium]